MKITLLYAGLSSLWFVVLSLRVIQKRRAGISLGDGGDPDMARRIRAHGNFAEYVPLALLMVGGLELDGASPILVHALGASLLGGRLLHGTALAFREQFPFGRAGGTAFTLGTLITAGCLCIARFVDA